MNWSPDWLDPAMLDSLRSDLDARQLLEAEYEVRLSRAMGALQASLPSVPAGATVAWLLCGYCGVGASAAGEHVQSRISACLGSSRRPSVVSARSHQQGSPLGAVALWLIAPPNMIPVMENESSIILLYMSVLVS